MHVSVPLTGRPTTATTPITVMEAEALAKLASSVSIGAAGALLGKNDERDHRHRSDVHFYGLIRHNGHSRVL